MTYRIASTEFGYPMYFGDSPVNWSDLESEAYVYTDGEGPDREHRLVFARADATSKGLDASKVVVESVA
jgi:hypothetical protein